MGAAGRFQGLQDGGGTGKVLLVQRPIPPLPYLRSMMWPPGGARHLPQPLVIQWLRLCRDSPIQATETPVLASWP